MKTHASVSGFSLIELLVAVAVLAILVGLVAIPAADSGAAGLDLAEVQIRDAFVTAQTLAYSLGVPHGVAFDPGAERFAVVAQNGQVASDPLTHGAYMIDFRRVEQPRGVTVESADFGATGTAGIFDGEGVPVTGGRITLGKAGATRALLFDAATGRLIAE